MDSAEQEIIVSEMEPKVFKVSMLHFIYRDALVEDDLIASSCCSSPLISDTLTVTLLAAADRMLHFIYRDALVEDYLIASSCCSSPLISHTLTAKLLAAADRYDFE
ncbi:BTB-POZ and MATH domain protein [Striga asiatica]|uniref:BTB-POZ and MATH domain protein n=1 Tax=Striga asiatica TaxID=4170 RepID=A0A5A7Q1T4_STRAF|nr:BTB-POZ and MATH domain protein [Striga asiatica]